MTDERDFDRLARAWLELSPDRAPERSVVAILHAVETTPQVRPWSRWLPGRNTQMNRAFMLATAVVTVVVIIGGGFMLTRDNGQVGAPTPSLVPKDSSAATVEYTWPAKLDAGTYRTAFAWDTPFTVTFSVPAGWESRDVEVFTDPVSRVNEVGGSRGLSVMFARVDNVFADPCGGVAMEPSVGGTVEALADALARLPGVDATTPAPVSLAGYQGQYLELSVRSDAGCERRQFGMWTTRYDWMKESAPTGGTTFFAERDHYRIWVLDVDGIRYVVAGLSAADATAADLATLQRVIDSIEIGM